MTLGDRQKQVLKALLDNSPLSLWYLHKELKIDKSQLGKIARSLVYDGLIEKCDPPKDYEPGGPPAQFFRLTKEGKKITKTI